MLINKIHKEIFVFGEIAHHILAPQTKQAKNRL